MTPPASANKAVFLSYASQDADAAKRIADTLRAAGIEVWFDQSDLRGGEAWDRSIRRQIKECALFLPVVSANTQARPEGYFRLEWHLAEQRSLLIAKGRPFIVPVVVDAVVESEAIVPDAFLAVQWTRLSSGVATPEFVGQVQRLLSGDAGRSRPVPPSGAVSGSRAPGFQPDRTPQIPDYQLLRQIGQGSYGDVWLARGLTGVFRAIKVVWLDRFSDAQPYEREFRGLKEFAAISLGESIQMALLHVGRNDPAGFFYYVMELADDVERGRDIDPAHYAPLTLAEVRARKGRSRVPAEDCLGYGVELARVLAGLHKHGLVHRDIKPANVILVGGVPKLADIGLVARSDSTMTFVGTEGFVPPEGPGSATADVFALGRLLYELATGLDRQDFPKLPADIEKLPDRRLLLELNEIILRACDPVAAERYPDGVELLADLVDLQAGNSIRGRRINAGRRRIIAIAAAAASLAVAGGWLWRQAGTPGVAPAGASPTSPAVAGQPPQVDARSVAVMAFANLSSDKEQEFFSDGISEELLNVLAKVPGLKVSARTSAFFFKGKQVPIAEIARQLGVVHLVEGSVRRAGDQVRITVSLNLAATGQQLWSESFTRDPKDIFSVQSEIAESVVSRIRGQLVGDGTSEAVRKEVRLAGKGWTKNPEAHAQFLQGRFWTNQFTMENLERAEGCFRRATELDPAFTLAWTELARTHNNQAGYTENPAKMAEQFALSKKAVDRALALDPTLAEAHAARAEMLLFSGRDWPAADRAIRQALALAPEDPTILGIAADLSGLFGLGEKGAALARRAVDLDPLNTQNLMRLASAYATLRRFPEAAALRRRILELSPKLMQVHSAQADDYANQGRFAEAVEEAKRETVSFGRFTQLAIGYWGLGNVAEADDALRQLKASGSVPVLIAIVYAARRDTEQAFAWLERGYQTQDTGLGQIRLIPQLASLRADPRWPVLLRKVGLHDDQLAEFLPEYRKTAAAPAR